MTSSTLTKNFLGIPVEGEINHTSRSRTPQKTLEEFGPVLLDLLNTPGVQAVRWRQYTPYFNDGEPCEFSTGEVYLQTTESEGTEQGDYEDGFLDGYALRPEGTYVGSYPGCKWVPTDLNADLTLYNALDAFRLGPFENVLREAFGDHATVTVTSEKITVEYYEHG
jgi:hypothetical protein